MPSTQYMAFRSCSPDDAKVGPQTYPDVEKNYIKLFRIHQYI